MGLYSKDWQKKLPKKLFKVGDRATLHLTRSDPFIGTQVEIVSEGRRVGRESIEYGVVPTTYSGVIWIADQSELLAIPEKEFIKGERVYRPNDPKPYTVQDFDLMHGFWIYVLERNSQPVVSVPRHELFSVWEHKAYQRAVKMSKKPFPEGSPERYIELSLGDGWMINTVRAMVSAEDFRPEVFGGETAIERSATVLDARSINRLARAMNPVRYAEEPDSVVGELQEAFDSLAKRRLVEPHSVFLATVDGDGLIVYETVYGNPHELEFWYREDNYGRSR